MPDPTQDRQVTRLTNSSVAWLLARNLDDVIRVFDLFGEASTHKLHFHHRILQDMRCTRLFVVEDGNLAAERILGVASTTFLSDASPAFPVGRPQQYSQHACPQHIEVHQHGLGDLRGSDIGWPFSSTRLFISCRCPFHSLVSSKPSLVPGT